MLYRLPHKALTCRQLVDKSVDKTVFVDIFYEMSTMPKVVRKEIMDPTDGRVLKLRSYAKSVA